MSGKVRALSAVAALIFVAVLIVFFGGRKSSDMWVGRIDKSCESPSEDVASFNGRFIARYTREACDYGFGSNYQADWIDVIDTSVSDTLRIQVLQLSEPVSGLDLVRWRDNTHLEVNINGPKSISRSLHEAGPVKVIYVASVSQSFLARGPDYARFVDWAHHNAEGGKVTNTAACSRYKGGLLQEPC